MREYFPGFLAAFTGACDGILRPEARTILAAAPVPADAAACRSRIRSMTVCPTSTSPEACGGVRGPYVNFR
jgi:hypothetical protein